VKTTITVLTSLVLLACGESGSPNDPTGSGATKSATIDQSGGAMTLEGATLTIPAGALDGEHTLTLTSTTTSAPSDYVAYSPVYQFEPAGLTFSTPVTLALDFSGDAAKATVYWTRLGSTTEFDAIGGTVSGDTITVSVTHFSRGFVGTRARTGDEDVVDDARADADDDTTTGTTTLPDTSTTGATDTGTTTGTTPDTGTSTTSDPDTATTADPDTGTTATDTTEPDASSCIEFATPCQADDTCCSEGGFPVSCRDGFCLPPCGVPGEPCATGGGCCPGMACDQPSQFCYAPDFCAPPGGACGNPNPGSCCTFGIDIPCNGNAGGRCCLNDNKDCVFDSQCCNGSCKGGKCGTACTASGGACVGNALGTSPCCAATETCIDGLKLLAEPNEAGTCGVRCRVRTETCTQSPNSCCQGLPCNATGHCVQ